MLASKNYQLTRLTSTFMITEQQQQYSTGDKDQSLTISHIHDSTKPRNVTCYLKILNIVFKGRLSLLLKYKPLLKSYSITMLLVE